MILKTMKMQLTDCCIALRVPGYLEVLTVEAPLRLAELRLTLAKAMRDDHSVPGCDAGKHLFWSHFLLKTISLPRQARDEHRKT